MTTYNLYSDGNYFPRAKKSGYGGYVEAPNGEVLVEYTEQIRLPQYAHSFELLGIIRGLQLAKSMGITHLHSHCDEKNTVTRLQEVMLLDNISNIPSHAKQELYQEILDLSKSFTKISFNYIPRNQNKHSDALSRRYSLLMEKNYLRQYQDDLDKSQAVLAGEEQSNKKIFFAHPSMIRIPFKNNPFLVAHLRNRKIRRISKIEEQTPYDYLFIESVISENNVTYNGFHYDQSLKEKQLINSQIFSKEEDRLNTFCMFFTECINTIKYNRSEDNTQKLWTYSNSFNINQYFEQKEKIPKKSIQSFQSVFDSLNGFNKVLFHGLPFEHTFSPEIAGIEKEKKKLGDSIESIDSLMEQLQNGGLGSDPKKFFGLLVKHHLRNYQNILERELNNLEKQEILQKTTDELIAIGIENIPEFKKMKM